MKRIVTMLIVLILLLFLGVLALVHVRGRNGGAGENMTAGQDQATTQEQPTETDVAEETASAVKDPVQGGVKPGSPSADENAPFAVPAVDAASAGNNMTDSASESGKPAEAEAGGDKSSDSTAESSAASSSAAADSSSGAANPAAGSGSGAGQGNPTQDRNRPSAGFGSNPVVGAGWIAPDLADVTPDSYQYFEYQVIAVTKKVLAEAAEYLKLPADSQPTDELLPAIYHVGGYRVIGYSAGYASASAPVELRMSRSEFFPDFYILPKNGDDESAYNDGELPPPDMDDEEDDEDDANEDAEDEESEDDMEDDGSDDGYNTAVGNNLATIFPFFGDPTVYGNEFFLDFRPPRIFSMESNMRKLSGFTNADYGDWGRGQSPIFDDNSFSSTLAATKGKPMIIAKALSGTTWILHVFLTEPQPMPETTAPAAGSENKLVRLDFQIVRAKWNEICAAGNPDGRPTVPSEEFVKKLMNSPQLRDFYNPTFRLIPSQEPVSIQLNAKTQFVPLKWLPAQEPGIPAIPLDTGTVWTGTSMQAAARILGDGSTVRLDYRFEKSTQTGWRNYSYSFFGYPEEPDPTDRYARPQQWDPEPDILSSTVRLPMLDTTAFRQSLYLEVGKPVLAARISNPAYQPDTLTLLFVTATVEDAQ